MNKKPFLFSILLFLFLTPRYGITQEENPAEEEILYNKEDNAVCLKCHGHKFFQMPVEAGSEETVTMHMYKGLQLDTTAYYKADHRTFLCTDCHSWYYNEYPHERSLKFEMIPTCVDCHAGDDAMAKYNFEGVEEEYRKSGHAGLPEYTYTCYSCHDPHGFKMRTRDDGTTLTERVIYDNSMCMNCHADATSLDLVAYSGIDRMSMKHKWLPNAANHFVNVRCIECHAEIRDDVMVPHHILPKEEAIRTCVECHTADSRLLHSLYKYQAMEGRSQKGFINGVISGQSYVIGANRSVFLNRLGVILVLCTLGGIFIHSLIRIIRK